MRKSLGKTPLTLKLAKGETARLLLRKDGFEEVERVVSASNQSSVTVELSAEPTEKPVDPPPSGDNTKPVEPPKTDPGKPEGGKQPAKTPGKVIKKGPKKKPAIF